MFFSNKQLWALQLVIYKTVLQTEELNYITGKIKSSLIIYRTIVKYFIHNCHKNQYVLQEVPICKREWVYSFLKIDILKIMVLE